MMATERQILANRENAKRSTGPKTPEGKARSRGNALKHGLAGDGVVLSKRDEGRVNRRLAELTEHLQPIDVLERILVRRVALASVRIESCERKEMQAAARRQRKAVRRWELAQQRNVLKLAGQLVGRPREALAALCSTSFGCDWLIGQWQALAALLDTPGHWTRDQALDAVRLLGHDPEAPLDAAGGTALELWQHALTLRPGADPQEPEPSPTQPEAEPGSTPPEGGPPPEARAAAAAALRQLIAAEQARLEALAEPLRRDQDEPAREAVEDCASVDTSEAGTLLSRYETRAEMTLHRNLNRLISLRKIEPEHQSIERWHRTGKLKPRRWNGINYEPTNPFYSSSYQDECEDAARQTAAGPPASPAGPEIPPPTAAAPTAEGPSQPETAGAMNEADSAAENADAAEVSGDSQTGPEPAPDPGPPPAWAGIRLADGWPEEPGGAEGDAEAPDDDEPAAEECAAMDLSAL